jgi:hypothetical protein
LASRLFFALSFAQRTADHFFRGTQAFDAARLAAELARLDDSAALDELHRQRLALPTQGALGLSVVARVLSPRLVERCAPAFRRLVGEVMATYPGRFDLARGELLPEPLWGSYLERRSVHEPLFGPRLDLYFRNYLKNFWMRDWYVDAPVFAAQVQNALVRVAVLRFLLLGHPGTAVAAALTDSDERARALDRVAVATFYPFSRAIENAPFLQAVASGLQARLLTLPEVASLLEV